MARRHVPAFIEELRSIPATKPTLKPGVLRMTQSCGTGSGSPSPRTHSLVNMDPPGSAELPLFNDQSVHIAACTHVDVAAGYIRSCSSCKQVKPMTPQFWSTGPCTKHRNTGCQNRYWRLCRECFNRQARTYIKTKQAWKTKNKTRMSLTNRIRRTDPELRHKSDEGKKRKHEMISTMVNDLRLKLSTNGNCSWPGCLVPYNYCDILHDNKANKNARFNKLCTIRQVQEEVKRNTSPEGVLELTLFCRFHNRMSRYQAYQSKTLRHWQRPLHDFINRKKREHRQCAYAHCFMPLELCTEGKEYLFDWDHLFVEGDVSVPPEQRKVCNVSEMIRNRDFDINDIDAEIKKCRLLHSCCHDAHTREQYRRGQYDHVFKAHRQQGYEQFLQDPRVRELQEARLAAKAAVEAKQTEAAAAASSSSTTQAVKVGEKRKHSG